MPDFATRTSRPHFDDFRLPYHVTVKLLRRAEREGVSVKVLMRRLLAAAVEGEGNE